MSTNVPTFPLTSGTEIPAMGYGVFQMTSAEVEKHLPEALAAGYTHIDTANAYFNEGRGRPRHQGVRRRARGPLRHDEALPAELPLRAVRARHRCHAPALDMDYVDLLLFHQPYGDYVSGWKAMEEAVRAGKVRAIGLSNFPIHKIDEILAVATIKPAVLQVEINRTATSTSSRRRSLSAVLATSSSRAGTRSATATPTSWPSPSSRSSPRSTARPPRRSSCAGATGGHVTLPQDAQRRPHAR